MTESIAMENVCIWGSVQNYVDVSFNIPELLERLSSFSDEASNKNIEFSEATNRTPFSFGQLYTRAKELDLVSRCRLTQPGAIIIICLPPGISALIACFASILAGGIIVPVSFEDVDNHDLNRTISLSKANVFISTRNRLLDCEYALLSSGTLGASFGGDGPLMVGAVDLTTKIDPRMPRISLNLDFQTSVRKDDSFMYFYDEKTKLLWDVTHRAASAIVQSCIRPLDMYWHEKVLSKVNGLAWLCEILPRLLAIPLGIGVSQNNETSTASDTEIDLPKTILVFDLLYQSRVRRRPLRRAGPKRVGGGDSSCSSIDDGPTPKKIDETVVSDLVELYLLAGQSRLGNVREKACLGIRNGLTCQVMMMMTSKPLASSQKKTGNNNQGRLCVFGPTTMRRVIGNPTKSVEMFFLDGDFRLWMDLNQIVTKDAATGVIHLRLSPVTQTNTTTAPLGGGRLKNLPLSERPIRRPIRLPNKPSSSSSPVLESNEQSQQGTTATTTLVSETNEDTLSTTSKL